MEFKTKKVLLWSVLVLLLVAFSAPLAAVASGDEVNPQGYLFRKLFGSSLEENYGIKVYGHLQAGVIDNFTGGTDVSTQGFLSRDEGFNLNQLSITVARDAKTNVVPRVGPFSVPKPEKFSFGFTVQGEYGVDAFYDVAYEEEADWGWNKDREEKVALQHYFVDMYFPILDGTVLRLGKWFTSWGYENGDASCPVNDFYTHPYTMELVVPHRFGAILTTKIPTSQKFGLLSLELGAVQGWANSYHDDNDDLSYIVNLRWRSPDMRTWLDIETIFGNNQQEDDELDHTPLMVWSASDENLFGYQLNINLVHDFDKFRLVLEAAYMSQEGGDDPGPAYGGPPFTSFFMTDDSEWYTLCGRLIYHYNPDVDMGLRLEYVSDKDGTHFLFPEGDIYSVTANVSWQVNKFVQIRPEIRYDWQSNEDFDLFAGWTDDDQFLGSIDVLIKF